MKAMQPSLRPGTRQVLVGFPKSHPTNPAFSKEQTTTHTSYTSMLFKPLGLLVWGVTRDTMIRSVQVGNQSEMDVSNNGSVPASYFETGRTFEELQRLADHGELEGAFDVRQILPASSVAHPGNTIQIVTEGPIERLCMWGLTSDGPVSRLVRIGRQTVAGPVLADEPVIEQWLGEVVERELGGDRVSLEVLGPYPEVVGSLIAALIGKKS